MGGGIRLFPCRNLIKRVFRMGAVVKIMEFHQAKRKAFDETKREWTPCGKGNGCCAPVLYPSKENCDSFVMNNS